MADEVKEEEAEEKKDTKKKLVEGAQKFAGGVKAVMDSPTTQGILGRMASAGRRMESEGFGLNAGGFGGGSLGGFGTRAEVHEEHKGKKRSITITFDD